MCSDTAGAREVQVREPLHCCQALKDAVEFRCTQHPAVADCSEYVLGFDGKFDEYGIWIHDGEAGAAHSVIAIGYCPFCGLRLPQSRRNSWFDRLDELKLEPEEAPDSMRRYGWWLAS
jgi:hypothetical protein